MRLFRPCSRHSYLDYWLGRAGLAAVCAELGLDEEAYLTLDRRNMDENSCSPSSGWIKPKPIIRTDDRGEPPLHHSFGHGGVLPVFGIDGAILRPAGEGVQGTTQWLVGSPELGSYQTCGRGDSDGEF